MTGAELIAMALVGGGMALLATGMLARVHDREEQLADILDLPWGEQDVDLGGAVEQHSAIVESTIGAAGKLVEQLDPKGSLLLLLEKARLPVRPGEFLVIALCGGLVGATLLTAVTATLAFGALALLLTPFLAKAYLDRRIRKRAQQFEEQFPEALGLIASSLSAGHTFLRAIQMMCEEADGPVADEFRRVVTETRLGDPLVVALDRMAGRVELRDVDWVVQAIRIQQTIGGRLADLLHTLADFIRARQEIRREVDVLTAEGRISAYVLGGLPLLLAVFIQVTNPGYLDPMFAGWGPVWLAGAALSVAVGLATIFRMIKVDV